MKDIKFDPETGEFIKQEKVKITDSNDAQDIINSINYELFKIVQQVKGLKKRAEELKAMKEALIKGAEQENSTPETIPDAPDEGAQSSPDQLTDSN